jgi:hypothetical protein
MSSTISRVCAHGHLGNVDFKMRRYLEGEIPV